MARHLSPGVVGEEGVDLIVGVDVRRHELARAAREREGGDDHGHEEGVDEPETNWVTMPPKNCETQTCFSEGICLTAYSLASRGHIV